MFVSQRITQVETEFKAVLPILLSLIGHNLLGISNVHVNVVC